MANNESDNNKLIHDSSGQTHNKFAINYYWSIVSESDMFSLAIIVTPNGKGKKNIKIPNRIQPIKQPTSNGECIELLSTFIYFCTYWIFFCFALSLAPMQWAIVHKNERANYEQMIEMSTRQLITYGISAPQRQRQ